VDLHRLTFKEDFLLHPTREQDWASFLSGRFFQNKDALPCSLISEEALLLDKPEQYQGKELQDSSA
jgi:hypothetical protein